MKLLFEFLPIFVFFVAYEIKGIYVVTGAAMIVSVLQIIAVYFKTREIPLMQWVTLVLIIVLGSATLLLHNPIFIKWKPSIVDVAFALGFFLSQWIGKRPLLERLIGNEVQLPSEIWRRLTMLWIAFFLVMAIINLIVVYNFSTTTWVYFKLFGTLGLTVVFVIAQAFYVAGQIQKK